MNWRDPPLKEHQIKAWTKEHNCNRVSGTCYHCGFELCGSYVRTVWANAKDIFVRKFHSWCA